MLRAIEMGWFVLNKYYTMTEEAPVYAAALLLNPSNRIAYLQKNWPADWHESAITSAYSIWEAEYKDRLIPDQLGDSIVDEEAEDMGPHKGNVLDRLQASLEVAISDTGAEDDFMCFIQQQATRIKPYTALQWWCHEDRRRQYPRLSQMAIDILSIPPESAEPERVFSGARRTCSWDRGRLKSINIERIECIGNWLKEGHIKPQSACGMGLLMEPVAEDELDDIDDQDLDAIEWF